jgi:hypothetical protein
LFERTDRLEEWRGLDWRDPKTLPGIAREIAGTQDETVELGDLQRTIARALFQQETVGDFVFPYFGLLRDLRRVRDTLQQRFRRRPSTWELVSAAVRLGSREGGNTDEPSASQNGPEGKGEDTSINQNDPTVPELRKLYRAYRSLENVGTEESLSPEARLADQIYRLGATLCVDGCPACLHQESSLMPDPLQRLAVSRELLQEYQEFLLEPSTLRVEATDPIPSEVSIRRFVAQHGRCRIITVPSRYPELRIPLKSFVLREVSFHPRARRIVLFVEASSEG